MARDPNNLNKGHYDTTAKNQMSINSIPNYTREDYDLNDPKDFKMYIKDVEREIRSSIEYQRCINYLRENAGMDHCAYLPNVTNAESFKIRIEIHHEPFTLYDIVLAVYNKRAAMREDLSVEMVAKEVIYIHYQKWVGLVPLCEMIHDLVHNQYLFVPSTIVFGQYKKFLEMYKPFIDPETLCTIEKIEKLSETFDIDSVRALIAPHILTIDASLAGMPTNMDDVLAYIKSNLDRLNNAKPENV